MPSDVTPQTTPSSVCTVVFALQAGLVVEAACDDAACTAPATATANTAAARGTATLRRLIRDPRLIETLTSHFSSRQKKLDFLAGGPAHRDSTDAAPAVDFKHHRQVPDRGASQPALEPRTTGSLRLRRPLSLNQGKISCWGFSPPYIILSAPWRYNENASNRRRIDRRNRPSSCRRVAGPTAQPSSNLSFPKQPECWRHRSSALAQHTAQGKRWPHQVSVSRHEVRSSSRDSGDVVQTRCGRRHVEAEARRRMPV